MSKTMTALDKVLFIHKHNILNGDTVGWKQIQAAIDELAQLRADLTQAIAERDAARAELASNKVYQRMAARR